MEIVSFVILHYKDAEVTDCCVRSILQMEDPQKRIRIVIVDNDIKEKDEKRKALSRRYEKESRITVLSVQENGGFSHANNIGYSFARERQGASFIVVLNNDIECIRKDFLRRLDGAYERNCCHILAPDIVKKSTGEHQNPMDTRIRTKKEAEYTVRMNRIALRWYPVLYPLLYLQNRHAEKQQLQQRRSAAEYYENIQKDMVPFGAGIIFTPQFVQQEKKAFEPETKFYYEEYLLTLRCQKKKYQVVYDPSIRLIHESGKATKAGFASEWKRLRFVMERTAEACEIYLNELGEETGNMQ